MATGSSAGDSSTGLLYRAYLEIPGSDSSNTTLNMSRLHLDEGYSEGWYGTAQLVAIAKPGITIGIGDAFGAVLGNRVIPGRHVIVRLSLFTDGTGTNLDGIIVRTWPCVVGGLIPFQAPDDLTKAGCLLHLSDPVTYLGSRPIWGAYRAESIGRIVGGALSLAAGGDGKPTLEPILPGLPPVQIVEGYREDLDMLPYAVAAGQTLGEWLRDLLGLLGVRVEMMCTTEDKIALILTDRPPIGQTVNMSLVGSSTKTNNPVRSLSTPETIPDQSPIYISGVAGYPSAPLRGGVLDDASLGAFRRFGVLGAVGSLHTGTEIGIEEASRRSIFGWGARLCEELMATALSRQPGLRPGRRISLDPAWLNIATWQIAKVAHTVSGGVYDNTAVLFPASSTETWHPMRPLPKAPRYVSAIVDGGEDHLYLEPVERDRLGRIPITFSFLPTPVGEEAILLATADTDGDWRLTLDDFTATEIEEYESESRFTSGEMEESYRDGSFDDPFPDRTDEELTEEELETRETMRADRASARKYIAYKRAKALDAADTDRDGWVSSRDAIVSETLAPILADDTDREELREQWESYDAGTFATDYPTLADDSARLALIEEYGKLFGDPDDADDPDDGEDTEDTDDEDTDDTEDTGDTGPDYDAARRDAELATQRWPPRIPLAVLEPMAGGLHGFLRAHRHGDVCRVAVHDPLSAEIIGFQYREDRRINLDIMDATAGFVVEHDQNDAWSGLVFRTTRQLEEEPDPTSDDTSDDTTE